MLRQRRIRSVVLSFVMGLVCTLGLVVVGGAGPAAAEVRPTIVLVHGAFADPSGFDDVARILRDRGYEVVVPVNPLRGPANDAAAIEKVLADISGPIVLVGHSYGGEVISNVNNPSVQALVFISAIATDLNEPAALLLDPIRFPITLLVPPVVLPKVVADPTFPGGTNVDLVITRELFRPIFAADVSEAKAAEMAERQRSFAVAANLELSGAPSWRTTPSWYLVTTEDRVVPASSQRFQAARMGASVREVASSHASFVAQPQATADIILDAVAGKR
ncbi:alpha/beta hydrolase [Antrihabitans sp. NCIMB 15449]|uniref:Alpha/beta hydrolase n=1 Tax=Antrihabitans spumae TaxID=3373370 RepID=A0ABW7JX06_9NOCA